MKEELPGKLTTTLVVSGEITEIKAPALFSSVAKKTTNRLFDENMNLFLENINQTLE